MTCLVNSPKPQSFLPELPEALALGFVVSRIPGAQKLIEAAGGKPGELPAMRMGPWGAAALFATAASAVWERLHPPKDSTATNDVELYPVDVNPATGLDVDFPRMTDTVRSATVISGIAIPNDVTPADFIDISVVQRFLQEMPQETPHKYETREYWQRLVEDLKATPQQQADLLTVLGRIALGADWKSKQWPGNFWYLTRTLFMVASARGFDPITDIARLRDPTGELACDWMCVQMDVNSDAHSKFHSNRIGVIVGTSAWEHLLDSDPYLGILEELIQTPILPGDTVGRYALIAGDLKTAIEALKTALNTLSESVERFEDLQWLVRMGFYDPQLQAALLYWATGMPGAPLDATARRESLYVVAKWVRELRERGVIVYGDVLGMNPAQVEVLRETAEAGDRVFISVNAFEILKPSPQSDLDAAEVLAMLLSRRQLLHPFDRPDFIRAAADVPGGLLRSLVQELLTPETTGDQVEGALDALGLQEIVDQLQRERDERESKIPPSYVPDRYKIWASAWVPFLDGVHPIDPTSPVLQALGNDYRRNAIFRMATDALLDTVMNEKGGHLLLLLPIAAQVYRLRVEVLGEDPARAWRDLTKRMVPTFRDICSRKGATALSKSEKEFMKRLLWDHLTPAEVRALFNTALENAIRDADAREVRIAHLIIHYATPGTIRWDDVREDVDVHDLLRSPNPKVVESAQELMQVIPGADAGGSDDWETSLELRLRQTEIFPYKSLLPTLKVPHFKK